MKLIVALVLALLSLDARADSFHVLVGYVCDKEGDQLLLTYDGAYNEAGEEMMAKKGSTQWDPWSLVQAKDDQHIGSLVPIRRKCRLSDGTYEITILPSPGNFDVHGYCGAWMTAGAEVKKGKSAIYKVDRFEKECDDTDSPIITRVAIKPGRKMPQVTSVPSEEFYFKRSGTSVTK